MRIIAGKHRSRVLSEFKDEDIRPTSDRAKEALFNILQNNILNADVLDLFGGTGNLGIEAISRGAKSVIFTDISSKSTMLIKENLKKINETADVLISDYRLFLEKTTKTFDIIFLDPPYKSAYGIEALKIIGKRKLLNSGGIAVFESDKIRNDEIEGLIKYDERKYGVVHFMFYKEE